MTTTDPTAAQAPPGRLTRGTGDDGRRWAELPNGLDSTLTVRGPREDGGPVCVHTGGLAVTVQPEDITISGETLPAVEFGSNTVWLRLYDAGQVDDWRAALAWVAGDRP